MTLIKIFTNGKVIDSTLYKRLQELDFTVFPGCGNEFQHNREWWVMVAGRKIVAYCGNIYSDGVCIFIRAWVHKDYRRNGIHRKMILTRLRAARKSCRVAITYTTIDNHPSANNLIRAGFLLYSPQARYAGDQLYFIKKLK